MGPGHAVYHIRGVLCWFCLSRLCTLFCVERSLSGLHSDICDQWRVNVFELPEVLFLNHHPQEEQEVNSLKSSVECQFLILNSVVNKLLVVLQTSSPRQIVCMTRKTPRG